jgi:hypothetical protein
VSKKQEKLVRFVSPFGTPAWMTREKAQEYLEDDDRRWVLYGQQNLLSEEQKQIGPPRIETHNG